LVMTDEMSSRERLLTAIEHKEPDHVPLYFKWWSRRFLHSPAEPWRDQFHRVEESLRMGLDDTVTFEAPHLVLSEDVKMRGRKEMLPGGRYPVLYKEYETPMGMLTQVVHQTADWPHGDDIPIFSDHIIPRNRSKKYLIETLKDVEALRYLYREPRQKEVEWFLEHAEDVKRFAREKEVLVVCGEANGILGGDAVPWLMGFENMMMSSVRNPELVHALLDLILEWDLRYVDLVLQAGDVDIICHRGWYECANFWTAKGYETFIEPRLRRMIEAVHKGGAKFCYIMSTGLMPRLPKMVEMDVDLMFGIDPVQGGADLVKAREMSRNKLCLWGGVNAAVSLTYATKEQIEKEVADAIYTLGPGGGFILSAIDQLFDFNPWEKIQDMIDAWKKMRAYPLTRPR